MTSGRERRGYGDSGFHVAGKKKVGAEESRGASVSTLAFGYPRSVVPFSFTLSKLERARLHSILQPPPNAQSAHPWLLLVVGGAISAVIGLATNLILVSRQGDEARKTAKIDRRIAAVQQASELIYRKGSQVRLNLREAWLDVSDAVSDVESDPFWPHAAGEAITIPAKRQQAETAVQVSARKTIDEAKDFLAEGGNSGRSVERAV